VAGAPASPKIFGTSYDYDFLLVFHSNCGPISYSFRDKRQYLHKFSTPIHVLHGASPAADDD